MYDNENKSNFDFSPFGKAIKAARIRAELTIDELADKTGLTSRFLSAIENEGKSTSVKTLITIISVLNISIDEIVYSHSNEKNSQRRFIDAMLDELDDSSLQIAEALIQTLVKINNKNCK